MSNKKYIVKNEDVGNKTKENSPIFHENQNQGHNTQKQALGPNTKR